MSIRLSLLATGLVALSTSALMAQSQPVTIRFAGDFAGKPFSCSSPVEGVGLTKTTATPSDFRLYVSEIELLRADGTAERLTLDQDGKWQFRDVALLDFENGEGACANGTLETRTVVTGTAAAGSYQGVRFKIGVPFDLNHKDPTLAPSPLNLTSMFWTWQGGYKFIKIDMATKGQPIMAPTSGGHHAGMSHGNSAKAPVPSAGFSLHLGSTMCQSPSRTTAPSSCANGNRIAISFDTFDPSRNVVVLDPAPVLATTNLDMNTPDTSPGCMSFPGDPECLTVMPLLGLAYADRKPGAQAFVRMR